jgi:transposase
MSRTNKKQYTNSEKLQVALIAIKGEMTISQISSMYQVHPTQIAHWKKQALEAMGSCFNKQKEVATSTEDKRLIEDLYRQIGKLSTECEWLKKKSELFKC